MPSFDRQYLNLLKMPPAVVKTVGLIHEYKGRQDLFKLQAPAKLENLRQVALIQSVESSSRIEGVTAPHDRFLALMEEKTKPENRSEGEISGYRKVLGLIHESATDIPLNAGVLLQFHRDLMSFTPGEGGRWKTTANTIDEIRPDGTRFTRFVPVEPLLTENAVEKLHHHFDTAVKDGTQDPLILIPLYVLDFLCIHPFTDGNGRMARLLTSLLLYHHGFDVSRYVSLERVIEQSKEGYYDTLYRSSQGWHEDQHDSLPWIEYWLSTVLAAYRELEDRVSTLSTHHGQKADIVIAAIDRMIKPFSISELQAVCPEVSRHWIKSTLEELKNQRILEVIGKGRGSKWRKIG